MKYPNQNIVMTFDGNSYCETDSSIGTLINGSQDFTIDAIVYTTDFYTKRSIIKQPDVFDFGVENDSIYFSITGFPRIRSKQENGVVNCNQFTHVTIVYKKKFFYLYINGVPNTSQSAAGRIPTAVKPFMIGEKFTGYISHVRIYQTALSGDEVKKYMQCQDLTDAEFRSKMSVYYDFTLNNL